ncbi:MAG TPA: hypothetical protein VN643_06880 [Pyrinomonadaceae bacterium]|nr:hypothetical protein [Pyrinomonadaceae bacterium]
MSNSAVSVSAWADMSEAQRIECVRVGEATLKEMVAGLLDGSEELRDVCSKFLIKSDVCLRQPPTISHDDKESDAGTTSDEQTNSTLEVARKRRLGLPEGYAPRVNRHESI